MNFRDFLWLQEAIQLWFQLSNASAAEQIWDVTDITNANRRVNKAGRHHLILLIQHLI
jgi:hypothetical protein